MSAVALGVAAESAGDVRIVQTLVDRVLIDEISWVAETFEGCRASMEDGLSPCRSWRLIAAWIPEDDRERKRHAALRGELHFDPCTKPEQLTSKNEADRKDVKRVLAVLTTTGRDALVRWADVPLERLEAHGGACGLARFVRELREHLVPIVERG
ncbi:hypothetical protein WME98_08565 [Sorangium sp. So ce296]|uniref:hypothetical protein n=1 Tax=Sorangium sp. So ce296 TaxID=3133296 RepID=UPI003F61034C